MKQLMLVRHAKSDWSDGRLKDFERPLNGRGERDAPGMAQFIAANAYLPQFILSSPANRAYSTARYFANEFEIPENDISTNEALYEASSSTILAIIQSLPRHIDRAAIFSHNPALTVVASLFSKDYIDNVPTCGVALIEAQVEDWKNFTVDCAKMAALHVPRKVLSDYKN